MPRWEKEWDADLKAYRSIYRRHGFENLFRKTFGDILVRPLGVSQEEFRGWVTANPAAEAMVESHLAAYKRLSRINMRSQNVLARGDFRCIAYRLGRELEPAIGHAIAGGVPARAPLLRGIETLRTEAGLQTPAAIRKDLEALVEEDLVASERQQRAVFRALLRAAKKKLHGAGFERGVAALFQDKLGRFFVIREGDNVRLDALLARYERERLDVYNQMVGLLR